MLRHVAAKAALHVQRSVWANVRQHSGTMGKRGSRGRGECRHSGTSGQFRQAENADKILKYCRKRVGRSNQMEVEELQIDIKREGYRVKREEDRHCKREGERERPVFNYTIAS